MIRSMCIPAQGPPRRDLPPEEWPAACAAGGMLWVDLDQPDGDEFAVLAEKFHFHPLAVEDCQHYSTLPKLDLFEDYFFLVVHAVAGASEAWTGKRRPREPGAGNLQMEAIPGLARFSTEVDIFAGRHFVVVSHLAPVPALDRLWQRAETEHPPAWLQQPLLLVHAILDALVDGYVPLLEEWRSAIDRLEEALLRKPGRAGDPSVLRHLADIRRQLRAFRRIVEPLADVVEALLKPEGPQVPPDLRPYYRDVLDHLHRAEARIEVAYERSSSLVELYTALASQRLSEATVRMNQVMQRLTAVATLFMPLTFITSLYGMNFRHMPELEWPWGYPLVLALMTGLAVGLYLYFRRHHWW
ncbi:MAG: magnesium transporter CorA family protein [Firmicutes bacterium]|nr:magnesium transporter CorA family protein [Bacillota bacterium]